MERAALALFDVGCPGDSPPLAPFMYLSDTGRAPSGCCWCIDPVHLRADSHGLILFDAETSRLDGQGRQALFATLGDFLSEAGWTLESSNAQRWYLRGPDQDQLQTTPLSRVHGRPVGDYLPRGSAAADWMQRCNELQMLLHSHPVNRERAARGLPAINSVWLWGGGELPEPGRRAFEHVYSDAPLLRGLALWNGSATDPVPPDADQLLQHPGAKQRLLLMPDAGLLRAATYADVQRWSEVVARHERDWFAPLLRAVAQRRLQELELIGLNGYRYRLGRRHLWRFWRRDVRWRDALGGQAA